MLNSFFESIFLVLQSSSDGLCSFYLHFLLSFKEIFDGRHCV